MNDTFVCDSCGEVHPEAQCFTVGQDRLCQTCAEEETLICSRCGERIWREDNAGTESFPLCQNCYDDYYTSCDRCGALISLDDAYYEDGDRDYPLCYDCYRDRRCENESIHDYGYKPEPIFHGNGSRYFGVELEIDEAGENDCNASEILKIANASDTKNLYCKHDGSLNDGFELVTHPMTLEYHLKEMPWEKILDCAKGMGYYSHKAGTCGLHIHVNRTAFGDTPYEQDAVIARILYFFEKHWEELLKFSRRTQHQLDQWAARYGYKDQPMEILDHAKKGYHAGRYTCVNLQNFSTIEFRIFRGTLKYNSLIATLQLVDRICNVALSMSDEDLKQLSWTTFAESCKAPELVRYLKERQLYVNEPVSAEEDE